MGKLFRQAFPWLGVAVFISALGGYLYAKSPTAGAIPLAPTAAVIAPVEQDESWFAVSYQGRRIGWTRSAKQPLADGKVRSDDEITLKMTLMGQPRDVVTKTQAVLDRGGKIESFTFDMESAGVKIHVEGVQEPGKIKLVMHSAGTTQPVEYPLSEPVVMSGNLPQEIARAGLKTGAVYSRSFFDPSVMKPATMRVEVGETDSLKVGARKITVFKVKQVYSGLETFTWMDTAGNVYKEESPTGFSSYRTTREEAMRLGDGPAIDLIDATSIQAENSPKQPRDTRRAVLELSGVDLAGFDLDGDGQKLSGNRLTIDRGAKEQGTADAELFTRAEPLLQVDDPAVQQAAREATGGLREPTEASRRILKWVYGALDKTSTVSLPSAVEVLRTKQGDCNEHAILYTAMARAAGVPTRVASGVVALDDRFYYHAWAEVFLDGRWLAVDPVFGQYPADASHIRFVTGGLERQAELMRVIGKLKIKWIEAAP